MGRGRAEREPKPGSVTYETILDERDGAVAIVTLNRPSVLNALNVTMVGELTRAFAEIEADQSVHVAILTGAGDRAFAAGADISELHALASAVEGTRLARAGQALTLQLERMSKPVIAAVNGFALGGGCELAMGCDIRLASDRAKFGQPEINLGLIPGYGGSQRTARLAGRGMAMLLCLTGELIDAHEAHRIGLVERVLPPGELLAEAKRIAGVIATKSPLAVAAAKRAIDGGSDLPVAAALEIEALQFGSLINTSDFSEGTAAFLQKRPPVFTGT
jgi:enoyl-CoA hydratase